MHDYFALNLNEKAEFTVELAVCSEGPHRQ